MARNYIGAQCPHCLQPMTADEDIVVCPECGAAHHRNCYQDLGHCVFEDKHSEGFEWSPRPVNAKNDDEFIPCPHCETLNIKSKDICTACGEPLHKISIDKSNADNGTSPFSILDEFDNDELIDDIPISDWKVYIGKSSQVYLFQFKRMDVLKRKVSICWTALLAPEVYFCYRKVWGIGILAFIIGMILSTPEIIYTMKDVYPEIFKDIYPGIFNDPFISSTTFETIRLICAAIYSAMRILCALYATWIYRKNAERKIKRAKAQSTSIESYNSKLLQMSGPSQIILALTGALLLMSLISSFLL